MSEHAAVVLAAMRYGRPITLEGIQRRTGLQEREARRVVASLLRGGVLDMRSRNRRLWLTKLQREWV